jgi:hypothetical protein
VIALGAVVVGGNVLNAALGESFKMNLFTFDLLGVGLISNECRHAT